MAAILKRIKEQVLIYIKKDLTKLSVKYSGQLKEFRLRSKFGGSWPVEQ